MRERLRTTVTFLALGICALAIPASAATTVKLATLVPEGSLWDKELKGMGQAWKSATDGRVELRIYPGGVAGDEGDVLRKIRVGQLQAATLTVVGLSEIDSGFNVFSIPRFFRSYDELFHVTGELTPLFEERLEEKGFVFLNWGHAGWVQLFTKKPARTPEEVQKLKLFTSAGKPEMVQWWKRNGFNPVPLSSTDIMTGLQTGMIEALPTTPLAALTLQWYRSTPYMLDLGIAPLVGATIVSAPAWKKISAEDRKALRAKAAGVEERLETTVPAQDEKAIEEMQKRGLELTRPENEAQEAAWAEQAEEFAATMREILVPEDVFLAAQKALDAYRARTD